MVVASDPRAGAGIDGAYDIISACVRSCPYSSAYSAGNVDASTLSTPETTDVLQFLHPF
jgi:hypothetical protein